MSSPSKELEVAKQAVQDMLNGNLNIIDGCRILDSILPDRERDQFLIFTAVASESELFPNEERAVLFEAGYLAKLQRKREEYTQRVSSGVLSACEELLAQLK